MSTTGWVVGSAAAILLAGAAVAAESDSQGAASSPSSGTVTKQKGGTYQAKDLRTLTLTVKQVDPQNHKVTFEATVKPEATSSSGKPIKLDQLKEGDQVRAAFDPKTGEVVRVDVTPAGGGKK